MTVDEIERAIENKSARPEKPITLAFIKRIRAGLCDSDFTPNGVRYFFTGLNLEEEQQD